MYTFDVWFKINQFRTAQTRIQATDWDSARLIAESQFGSGNIINITMVYD
jgi:hypothetical protein